MAYHINASTDLDLLADKLIQEIKTNRCVFEPVYIVTQTIGMTIWLKLKIAQKMGISANIEFLQPTHFLHQVFKSLKGTYTKNFAPENLTWLIYVALGEDDFKENFSKVAEYYDNTPIDADIKRMGLAQKISDLFDQYPIYRPEMIEKWNETDINSWKNIKDEDEQWQFFIWKKIRVIAGDSFPDQLERSRFIREELKKQDQQNLLKKKIGKVHFFGISILTRHHQSELKFLSAFIDVNFFLNLPSQNTKSADNRLLQNWGELSRETLKIISENNEISTTFLKSEKPSPETALSLLQNSIQQNQSLENPLRIDPSITINSCFSPFREVEVFYNYLIHLIHQEETQFKAQEIVVMVSDIDKYAPFIRAIFENSPLKDFYAIADHSLQKNESISESLIAILSLNEDNFTSENVIGLLDSVFIQEKFGLKNTTKIRQWIKEANIKFGIDGKIENDTKFISWKYGLDRILYGICMSGSQEYGEDENSFYPIDLIEGYEMNEAIRLIHFVELLMKMVERQNQPLNLQDWLKYVEEVFSVFIGARDEIFEEEYKSIWRSIDQLQQVSEQIDEKINYQVFLQNFLKKLGDTSRENNYISRGITFCSQIPMRSIPFKLVAMLGMDYDKFPRKDKKLSFDLIHKNPFEGDRNVKNNDKQLFLDSILSAQNYFYISYTGQSVKNKTELPASVVVDELISYMGIKAKEIITVHPLHGFSKKYNSEENKKLYSYLLKETQKIDYLKNSPNKKPEEIEEISLLDFINFFKNPIKAYYNKVLKVYYNEEDTSLAETELFKLNNLVKWGLKNELLTSEETDYQMFKTKKVKTEAFLLGNQALIEIENLDKTVVPIREQFLNIIDGKETKSISVNYHFKTEEKSILIKGNIDEVYQDQLVKVCFSKENNSLKYKVEHFINFLLLNLSGYKTHPNFIDSKGDLIENNANNLDYVGIFKNLYELYKEGMKSLLHFNCDIGLSYKDVNLSQEGFSEKIHSAINNEYSYTDDYIKKEYDRKTDFSQQAYQDFEKIAKVLLKPVEEFFSK